MSPVQSWWNDPRVRVHVRWIVPAAITLVLLVLLSPGFAERSPAPEPAPAQRPAPVFEPEYASRVPASAAPIEVMAVEVDGRDEEAADADETPRFECVLEPWEVVELGSPVTGVIDALHVERSEFVEAGQVVAELESGVEEAAMQLARARGEMQGEVRAREASHSLGQRRKQRVEQLFERETLSLDLRDQAETEAEIARLEVLAARENKRLAALEAEQARQVLARRTIRSPISGFVVDRLKAPGEVVDEETILTIAQVDPLRVEVILPSAMYGEIQPGMRAAVEPEFPGDTVHVAEVKLVDRVIDAASGTFGVRLELPNADHAIPGGLHCQVRFLTE